MLVRPARAVRTIRPAHREVHRAEPVGRRSVRRNRRRGAPRSALVRRVLAVLLAAGAALLILRPTTAQPPSPAAPSASATAHPPGIPLVLPIADAATTSVLSPGDTVDLYAAHGEQPPVLLLTGVPLIDIQEPGPDHSGTLDARGSTYVVVHITSAKSDQVQSLLSATWIVATISATNSA